MAEHPFYVRQTAEPEHTATPEDQRQWFIAAQAQAQAQGAKFARISVREEPVPMLLIEAWAKRPDDQGEPRWCVTNA